MKKFGPLLKSRPSSSHKIEGTFHRLVAKSLPADIRLFFGTVEMSLRRWLGYSDGDLMRSDAKPCSRLMRQTAAIFSVGGGFSFWIFCRLHYGPRMTVPRILRWAACGAVTMSSTSALLVRLLSPECEPQNIAAYDKVKPK